MTYGRPCSDRIEAGSGAQDKAVGRGCKSNKSDRVTGFLNGICAGLCRPFRGQARSHTGAQA